MLLKTKRITTKFTKFKIKLTFNFHTIWLTVCLVVHFLLLPICVFHSQRSGGSDSKESPQESPQLVPNGGGPGEDQERGVTGMADVCQIPGGHPLSPLTSPLLIEAGYVRHDDEEEARRKVCLEVEKQRIWLDESKNEENLQNTCIYTPLFYNLAIIGQQKAENKVEINKHISQHDTATTKL